jgi:hypothetical protein
MRWRGGVRYSREVVLFPVSFHSFRSFCFVFVCTVELKHSLRRSLHSKPREACFEGERSRKASGKSAVSKSGGKSSAEALPRQVDAPPGDRTCEHRIVQLLRRASATLAQGERVECEKRRKRSQSSSQRSMERVQFAESVGKACMVVQVSGRIV